MPNSRPFTGIDIQEGFVHVAQAAQGVGGPRVIVACSAPVEPGAPGDFPRRAAAALKSLIRDYGLRVSRPATVLPDSASLFRNTLLPAGGIAELAGMAALEMEYYTMLPPGELNVSFYAIGEKQPGGIRTGIAAAKRTAVASHLETLRAAGMFPQAVVTGGVASAQYFQGAAGGGLLLAVHGAKSGASIYFIENSTLLMSQYIPLAGEWNENERLGAIVTAARLATEQFGAESPEAVVLFGDTDSLPAPASFETEFGAPATVSDGCERIGKSGLGCAQRAAGAALGMLEGAVAGVNLLPENVIDEKKELLYKWLLRAAAAILIIGVCVSAALGSSAIRSRHNDLAAADAVIAKLKPRAESIANKQKQLAAMNISGANDSGCLDSMAELSRILPEQIFVTGLSFEKGQSLTLSAETASQAQVAAVIAALERSPMFEQAQLSYSRQTDTPDGTIVSFEIKTALRKAGTP